MNDDNENHNDGPQKPKYIDGVGWRRDTIHRMTRWPEWKDSRKPGTYMFTLNVNGARKVLGTLHGTTAAVYTWMAQHPEATTAASADPLYYRHALLATRSMPFVLPSSPADEVLVQCRFGDIAPHLPAGDIKDTTQKNKR